MFEKQKTRLRGWKAVGASLALLGTAAVTSHANAQQANQPADQAATTTSESMTVVRDAETGRLRAPTNQELETLRQIGETRRMRAAPGHNLQKFHSSGATGVRLTDDFMGSNAVAVRNAKGGIDMQCLEPGHSAMDMHSVASHGNQPVER
ncbi:MAG: hypothetical protein JWR21_744 [Herminiimonas sp.]|nr:hypothetical protein [Herminiimonas sp.]